MEKKIHAEMCQKMLENKRQIKAEGFTVVEIHECPWKQLEKKSRSCCLSFVYAEARPKQAKLSHATYGIYTGAQEIKQTKLILTQKWFPVIW